MFKKFWNWCKLRLGAVIIGSCQWELNPDDSHYYSEHNCVRLTKVEVEQAYKFCPFCGKTINCQ